MIPQLGLNLGGIKLFIEHGPICEIFEDIAPPIKLFRLSIYRTFFMFY